MSKGDACKVTSASKHKERKPKKPHYIPRPWGKPYNYKCFQCPFTCMEKSHLYNHMKYSLCKNSLSLLIESDWPYKKGNLLHPEQLRAFQPANGRPATGRDGREQLEQRAEDGQRQRGFVEEDGEDGRVRGAEDEEEGGRAEGPEVSGLTEETSGDHGLLSEQWRLLASGHPKAKAEGAPPRVSGSIPCYPPPPNLVDYQDPTGLNLSVLGVGYPISPGLFSYMNSAIPAAAAAVSAQTHAQLAQLPFLASAAQLMHPASGAHADRALIPPRLYYPFLCEHAFGPASAQGDAGKALKASASGPEANPLSGFQPKVNLWKVPALRPERLPRAGHQGGGQDAEYSEGGQSSGKTRLVEGSHSVIPKPQMFINVSCSQLTGRSASAPSLGSVAQRPSRQPQQRSVLSLQQRGKTSESVAALLSDLSKALQEYQEAEGKISHLEKEDLPAQRHLWEHLGKIRSELSHIHQALERTARQSDGPLDLSVKRDSADSLGDRGRREDGGP
uniref:Si:ch211-248l17.3 n=1 Tax=Gasterosteus aculeatus TaxID=69293 RepID=G3P0I0_GASAC